MARPKGLSPDTMGAEDRKTLLDLFTRLERRSGEKLVAGSTAAFPDIRRADKSITWARAARLATEALNQIGSLESLESRELFEFFLTDKIEYEREQVYRKYRALQGRLVRGLVLRTVRETSRLYDFGGDRFLEGDELLCRRQKLLIVALEHDVEAVLPVEECLRDDRFTIREFVEAEIIEVGKTPRGPLIVLSRARSSFLQLIREQAIG